MTDELEQKQVTNQLSNLRKRGVTFHQAWWGFIFMMPALLFFATFFVYPIFWAAWISLNDWGLLDTPSFVGFENYKKLFNDQQFWKSVWATFYYTVATVVPIWFLGFGLALLFKREFPLRRTYLTIIYMPAVISLTVWCLLFLLIYQPSYGLLTLITRPLGFETVRWLNDPQLAMISLVILSIIKGTPAYMIIYLAGLSSIPNDYYEAAVLDGAGPIKRTQHITLPLMRPIFLYVGVLSIINAFQAFAPAYILTKGGPGSTTRVLPLFIFENGFSFFKMGYASAASIIMFLFLLLLTLLQFRLLSSRSGH